jgi:parvulin-like peptidyl-prolyl isomerase
VKPDRLHVRAIFLASDRGSDREKVKRDAAALHAVLLKTKAPEREARFEAIARERSDLLASRDSGGDLGPRTPADLAALVGEGVQACLGTLQQTGTLTEVLETERGFLLLYLRGRQPGLTQSFESVKARLAQRLIAEGRARALEELISRLRKQRSVSIDDSLVGQLAPESPIHAETSDGG